MNQQLEDSFIAPIDEDQRADIVEATHHCIEAAARLYQRDFAKIPVAFDLRGKCAGMYQRDNLCYRIRFNPWLFAKYYQQSLEQTVPHEVAHYISDCLWGLKSIQPHGPEWKSVVRALGGQPKATVRYCTQGIPTRQYQRFDYQCGCKTHHLTMIRHRRVRAGMANYRCRLCGQPLIAIA
jgi:SprT protein